MGVLIDYLTSLIVAGSQAVLLHVDFRRIPVQIRALYAERLGNLLRFDAHRHEHREVLKKNQVLLTLLGHCRAQQNDRAELTGGQSSCLRNKTAPLHLTPS